uniref:Uncharacterized protein n=1 Tax=Rhizophora mucronata TaxID=61149 RepID=A0A2P2PZA2_RHIMU
MLCPQTYIMDGLVCL